MTIDIHAKSQDLGYSIAARGPLSAAVLAYVRASPETRYFGEFGLSEFAQVVTRSYPRLTLSDDAQLSLFVIYGLSYRTLHVDSGADEWDPVLVEVRRELERALEAELRAATPSPHDATTSRDGVVATLLEMTAPSPGPSVARYLSGHATREQFLEFLMHRSIYQLREADPHSWAIPRLSGKPKAALVEIQADEYGGGRPDRVHAELFAQTMRGAGLSDKYGYYVNAAPAATLASLNLMSMFGLNARLLGAAMGHLAAFEMSSTTPNAHYAKAARRLGFGDDVAEYFDEHVEADAVHEQIAAHDLAGALAAQHPELSSDILFGAASMAYVDGQVRDQLLAAWEHGASSLLIAGNEGQAA